jgi:formylmethanofuran dehydrogenase subunit D
MQEPKNAVNGTKAEYRSIIGDLSFSVCLPKKYSQNLGLDKGDYVRVTQEDGKIIIEKAR